MRELSRPIRAAIDLGTNTALMVVGRQHADGRVEILDDIHAGKGMAGALINDPQLNDRLHQIADNFTTLSSNLTKYGLLYKPRKESTTPPASMRGRTQGR